MENETKCISITDISELPAALVAAFDQGQLAGDSLDAFYFDVTVSGNIAETAPLEIEDFKINVNKALAEQLISWRIETLSRQPGCNSVSCYARVVDFKDMLYGV